jgi:SanA protein
MSIHEKRQAKPKTKRPFLRRLLRVTGVIALAAVLVYCALIGYVYYRETHVPAPEGYDSIIVLGAQVKADGEPSLQLRWRLDKALEMYLASPCVVVVCGAQGGDEPRPEGDVMRELLIADGVPENLIYADTASMDTRENMENAKLILDGLGLSGPLIVTSDYHLPRAMAIASDAGLTPQGAGSPCKPDFGFWLKNHGREALAWVKYWLVKYTGLKL